MIHSHAGGGAGGKEGRGRGGRGEGKAEAEEEAGGGERQGMAKLGMTRSLEHVATHTSGRTYNQVW